MVNLKKIKIAVVYGGISKERPGSLVSGKRVIESLEHQGYNVFPVDPKHDDIYQKLSKADAVFLALHGRYGEDGKIQGFLETLQIPYVGSGVIASALGMDKLFFKKLLTAHQLPAPKYEIFDMNNNLGKESKRITKILGLPLFLKPISEGGSLGAAVIHSQKQLAQTVRNNKAEGFDKYIVEEYIKGRAMTVGLLERKKKLVCLPVLETVSKKEFYDYEAKHDSKLHIYHCPADLPKSISSKIEDTALKVHHILGCHGFSRVDFMLDQKNNIYILEVNTLPGMSAQSNMATMAEAAGVFYDQLVVKMLKTAFTKPEYLP